MFSLFPQKEEWGTGDEALDNRLTSAFNKVKNDLTFDNIKEFYFYGLGVKPRAYNPAFYTTIEFVTKALLYLLLPEENNDLLLRKLKGDYEKKQRVTIVLPDLENIVTELRRKGVYRYRNQIDFYLHEQQTQERNPFVRHFLKRSPLELHAKIIMKDFKLYLKGEKNDLSINDPLFLQMRGGEKVVFIEHFGEFWYHEDQIFSLPTLD